MTDLAEIYREMHNHRFDLIDERRRARTYQANLADKDELVLRLCKANADILELVHDTAQRYSRGSVTRVALDNLALEIQEIL